MISVYTIQWVVIIWRNKQNEEKTKKMKQTQAKLRMNSFKIPWRNIVRNKSNKKHGKHWNNVQTCTKWQLIDKDCSLRQLLTNIRTVLQVRMSWTKRQKRKGKSWICSRSLPNSFYDEFVRKRKRISFGLKICCKW